MIFGKLAIAAAVVLLAAGPALAQSSRRANTSEIYIGPVFTDGKNYSLRGRHAARAPIPATA